MISSILIVVAMMEEAQYFKDALHLVDKGQLQKGFPTELYEGEINNKKVHLVVNGTKACPKLGICQKIDNVASQAAVLSTTLGILKFQPDLIISSGTAGGVLSKDALIQDIYISTENNFMARRMPGTYEQYGVGHYKSFALPSELMTDLALKPGVVCSSDSFNDDATDDAMSKKLNCSVEEMEAAGVAWVSSVHGTPMFSLKGIVDHTGSPDGYNEFQENFDPVMRKLSRTMKQLIEGLK